MPITPLIRTTVVLGRDIKRDNQQDREIDIQMLYVENMNTFFKSWYPLFSKLKQNVTDAGNFTVYTPPLKKVRGIMLYPQKKICV